MKKFILALILSAALCVLAGCGNKQPEADTASAQPEATQQTAVSMEVFETPVSGSELIGLWVNEENSVSIRFNDDGTYVNDSIEGTYTHEGNTLTLTYGGGQVVEDYSVGIRDGQLVLVRDDFQMIFEKSE